MVETIDPGRDDEGRSLLVSERQRDRHDQKKGEGVVRGDDESVTACKAGYGSHDSESDD